MNILLLTVPISLLIAAGFLWAFIWAVRSGQFDDTQTPAHRMLVDHNIRGEGNGDSEHEA